MYVHISMSKAVCPKVYVREYVNGQGVCPSSSSNEACQKEYVRRHIRGYIQSVMSKGCFKVFITQESISTVYVKVFKGYVQGGMYKGVFTREYV